MTPFCFRSLLACLAATPVAAQVGAVDTNITAGLPATLTWADWSGDGLNDAFAAQPDGSALLLENAGDGQLADRTVEAGLGALRGVRSAVFGDVDGDGQLDLFVSGIGESSRLFLQGTAGDFVDVTQASGIPEGLNATEARWIDYDADGVLDLHVQTASGDQLYRGLGRAQFAAVDLGLAAGGPVQGAAAGAQPTTSAGGAGSPGGTGGGASTAAASGSGPIVSVTPLPPAANAGNGTGICAGSIEDMATGSCIAASSAPQLGTLYPLSSSFYVSPNGSVGMGTTSPGARLEVAGEVRARIFRSLIQGAAPFIVASNRLVTNLNADLLDGLSSSSFRRTNSSILGSDILNGTITNIDVSSTAAIAGTKVVPSFGGQVVQGAAGARFDRSISAGAANVRGASPGQGIYGYLGGLGTSNYAGVPSADFPGYEMGVVGLAVGTSGNGKYGVIGHGSTGGVRGENSAAPLIDFGVLGAPGVGIFARGTAAAGRFDGEVEIDNDGLGALTVVGGSTTGRAATITNPNGGASLSVFSSSVGSTSIATTFNVNSQNRGIAARIDGTSLNADLEVMRVSSRTNSNGHDTSYVLRQGTGSGSALRARVSNTSSPADGIESQVQGSGRGLFVDCQTGTGVYIDKAINTGDLIAAANGTDVEFRVESSGNVRCDGMFVGGGADYAEWLPRASAADLFRKGDVVGVFAGEISHDLEGADSLLVISSNPVLVGNARDAADDDRDGYEVVAFLGQVPVRVRGVVHTGDLLVPSGDADGTAVAVSPEDLASDQIANVIGRAWESGRAAKAGDVHLVTAAVGLERDRVAAIAIEAMRAELDGVQSLMEAFAERLDALEQQR